MNIPEPALVIPRTSINVTYFKIGEYSYRKERDEKWFEYDAIQHINTLTSQQVLNKINDTINDYEEMAWRLKKVQFDIEESINE